MTILVRTRIDALVTDVEMPGGLDGFDLAAPVRRLYPCVTILVTSGGRSACEAKMPRGCAFLAKPYRLEDVLMSINVDPGDTIEQTLIAMAG